MRLQMPGDDEVVRAFAEAQGPRALSPAVRHLIHMWVNEFGPVSVMDLVLSGVTMSRTRSDAASQGLTPGTGAGGAGLAPQASWPAPVPSGRDGSEPEPGPEPADDEYLEDHEDHVDHEDHDSPGAEEFRMPGLEMDDPAPQPDRVPAPPRGPGSAADRANSLFRQ